ncbi:MAG: DNA topoisomerase I, partial [Candidatus Bathyarchaeia archaeon]
GRRLQLSPGQEEMAVAWVKKLPTEYVKDPVFARNFFQDFSKALGLREALAPESFDFSEVAAAVEQERQAKLSLSKEERRRLAAERKLQREANKAKYGYAFIDGVKVELGNYVVEPSGIFMGRGKHPLRGRWKQGATERDITLNLSPGAPVPPGSWGEIVWEPGAMWIARWKDKLSDKMKYVWLSDTALLKQRRDIEKFNMARELEAKIGAVRSHIERNLVSPDPARRKLATVSYLIDALKLRVGDEKDEDEADTVGATTLRPEHIHFRPDGLTTFDFLGKDSVRLKVNVALPTAVAENVKQFMAEAKSAIFEGVRSQNVSAFLGEVMPGLTAKVFRTYHASKAVKDYLDRNHLSPQDHEQTKRYVATMANLQAAILCNHKRTVPKNWQESLAKKQERLKKLDGQDTKRAREARMKLTYGVRTMKASRDYNLRTSLKSYIDPRIYRDWGRKVGFDWKRYYPAALQRKFSWVDEPTADRQDPNIP